jgi:hypothetical protein
LPNNGKRNRYTYALKIEFATFVLALSAMSAAHAGAPIAIGAFLSNPNGSDASAEATFEANASSFQSAVGTAATLVDVYVDKSQPVSSWQSNASWQAWSNAQSPVARKMTPVIGFPMASDSGGSPAYDQQFQAFAAGQYDYAIRGVLQSWAAQGFHTLILRVGWEMNIGGDTYVGDDAQSQHDWVLAFRHIYNVMHNEANSLSIQIKVVWNPSATNYTNAAATRSLYPGDAYVDIIGADIYGGMFPFSDGSGTQYHDWATGGEDYSLSAFMARSANRYHYWTYPAATKWSLDGSNGHSQSFLSLANFARAHGKPFAVPECGAGNSSASNDVSDDATFPNWLGTTLAKLQTQGLTVSFVNAWDTNDWGNYQFSYGWNAKPAEAAAWKKYVGALVNWH